MNKKELSELSDLKTSEVSLVDKGANKKKRFPIFKQETDMDEEILKTVLEMEVDEEAELEEWIEKQKLDAKGINAVKGALRLLTAYKDKLPSDALNKLAAAAGYPGPKTKQKEEEEEEDKYPSPKKKQKKKPEEEEEEMKKIQKEEALEKDLILKAQEDQIKNLQADYEKIEKAFQDEKNRRELETWISKAREELKYLPNQTPEEVAKSLKELADFNSDLAEKQFEQLKSVSKIAETSELFQELGSGQQGVSGSAWDKITKAADGLVEKSGAKFSEAEAIDRFLSTSKGAELYNEYLKEHPAQTGGR
jgi:type III secretory pathway component EscV